MSYAVFVNHPIPWMFLSLRPRVMVAAPLWTNWNYLASIIMAMKLNWLMPRDEYYELPFIIWTSNRKMIFEARLNSILMARLTSSFTFDNINHVTNYNLIVIILWLHCYVYHVRPYDTVVDADACEKEVTSLQRSPLCKYFEKKKLGMTEAQFTGLRPYLITFIIYEPSPNLTCLTISTGSILLS